MALDFQSWADDVLRNGRQSQQPSQSTGGMPSWMDSMRDYYNQVQQVNRGMQDDGNSLNGDRRNERGRRSSFVDMFSGGTENMYNGSYQEANALDRAAIETARDAEWWNNALANITGNQDLAFDPSKFDISRGLTPQNAGQIFNFVGSLPGMMVGGVLEGGADLYEAFSGRPINEYRATESGYEIPDYELDITQKGADLLDSAINIGGLAFGGSARALSRGAKAVLGGAETALTARDAAKAAQRVGAASKLANMSKKLDKASHGLLENAWEATGHEKAGFALQTGFDIAEEAGEEYVQSLAEDVRNKEFDPDSSFDKASQAAAWGALGGGVMSVGGRALGKLGDKAFGPQSDQSASRDDELSYRDDDYAALQRNPGTYRSNEVNEYLTGIFREKSEQPGSGSAKCFMGRTDVLNDEVDVADSNLMSMYESSAESQDVILKDWQGIGVSRDEFEAALYRGEFGGERVGSAADALNMLLDSHQGKIDLVLQRTPGTHGGRGKATLRRFTHGDGVSMDPLAYGQLGGDTDGDQVTVFWGAGRYPEVAYFSDQLNHPEGVSNATWWYSQISQGLSKAPGEVNRILEPLKGYKAESGETLYDSFRPRFMEALKRMDDNELSSLFMDVGEQVADAKRNGRADAGNAAMGGRMMKNTLISQFGNSRVNTVMKVIEDTSTVIDSQVKVAFEAAGISETPVNFLKTRGRLGSAKRAADLWDHMGFLAATVIRKGNIPFRQYGQAGFTTKTVPSYMESVSELVDYLGEENIVNAFIRASFGMTASGVSPSTSIEGILESFTVAKTLAECDMVIIDGKNQNVISTQEQLDNFLDTYVRVYNEYTKVYEKAKLESTSLGEHYPVDYVERNDLSGKDDPALIGNIRKTFGSTPFSMLFDTSYMTENVGSWTFGEFVDAVAKRDGSFDAYFAGNTSGDTFNEFIAKIQADYGVTKKRMSSRFEKFMDSIGPNAANAMAYYDDHGDFGSYSNFVIEYVNMLCGLMDPAVAIEAGLLDPRALVETAIGRELFDMNADTRKNAFISLNMYHQFNPARQLLLDGDDKSKQQAAVMLSEIADVSPLHAIIANELVENDGDSKTLANIVDNDRSFEEKKTSFNGILNKEVDSDFDYAIDCLRTEKSEFDLSTVSARMRRSESYLGKAQKMLYAESRKQFEDLKSQVQSNSAVGLQLEGYMREIGRLAPSEVNLDLIGAQVYESMIIAHKAIDKGTTQQVNGEIADSLAMVMNGCMSPKLVTEFGLKNGIVDVSMFQSNFKMIIRVLTSPPSEYTISLRNERNGQNATLNRDTLFATVGIELNGVEPNHQQWLKLFERYPQLLDWISTMKANAAFTSKTDTVVPAKSQSFMEGFGEYQQAHIGISPEDDLAKYEAMKGVRELSNILLDNPKYKTYMIGCLSDKLEDKSITPSELSREVVRFHQDTTKLIYLALHAAPGGTLEVDTVSRFKSRLYSGNFDAFRMMAEIGLEIAQNKSIVSSSGPEIASILDMSSVTQGFLPIYTRAIRDTIIGEALEGGVDSNVSEALKRIVETSIGDMYSNINAAYEKFGSRVEQHMDVISALFNEFAGSAVVKDPTRTVDPTVVTELKKEISSTLTTQIRNAFSDDPNVDSIVKHVNKLIEDETDSIVSEYEAAFREEPDVSGLVLNVDEDFKDQATLREKVRGLYRSIGSYERTDDEIDLETEDALSKRDNAIEYRNIWLSNIIEHEIMEINSITQSDMNPNMLTMTQDIASFYDDIFDNGPESMRKKLDAKGVLYQGSRDRLAEVLGISNVPFIPQPKTTSTIAQIAATNMRIMDDSAGTAILVSINGAQMKQHFGYTLLPAATKTSSKPTAITAGELKQMIIDDDSVRRWKMVTSGAWDPNDASSWQVDSIGSKLDRTDDDAEVLYFDPIENPHGLSDANTPATPEPSPRRIWHRLSGILGKLDDTTMEAMVMKAKKFFASKEEITEKFDDAWFNDSNVSVDVGDGSDAAATYDKMRNVMREFRRSYALAISKEFKKGGSLDSTEFDMEQATLLACNFTPGMRVTVDDGVKPYDVMVDSGLLFGDETAFKAAWPNIINAGAGPGTIVSCRVYTVTPTEFSYKIMNPVLARFHETGVVNGVDVNRTAERAAENWGDYRFENLSIQKVLDGIKPIGYHIRHGVRLSDSQTAPQIVLDEEFGGSLGTSTARVNASYSRAKYLDVKGKDKSLWNTAQQIARNIGISNDVPGIVKAYLPEKLTLFSYEANQDLETHLSQARNMKPNGFMAENGRYSAGIVLDPRQLQDALVWATASKNDLIIPKSVISDMSFGGSFMRLGYVGDVEISAGGDVIDCIRIAPRKSNYFRRSVGDVATSHRLPRHPDEIMMTFIDYQNLFKLTDAGIYATDEGEKLIIKRGNYAKFKVSKMLPDEPGTKKIADKNALLANDSIMSLVTPEGKPSKDKKAWKKVFGDFKGTNGNEIHIKRLVADYIANISGLADDDGIMRQRAGKDQCIGFVTNGIKFAPIITPGNSASEYSYVDVQLIGDELLIPWSGSTTLGGSTDFFGNEYMRYMKMAINGEAFKGIVSVLPSDNEGIHVGVPELALQIGGKQHKVHFIAGGETEGSRAAGRDQFFQHQAMFEAMHKFNGSLIFKIGKDGKYAVNDSIARVFDEADLRDMMNGEPGIWSKIKNQETKVNRETGEIVGRYVLSDNDETNDAITMVLSNCETFHIDPMPVLSALTWDFDGNIVPDWSDVNYHLAFYGLDFNKTALFFSGMLQSDRDEDAGYRFCPAGINDPAFKGNEDNYLFNDRGWTRCSLAMENGKNVSNFYPIRWGKHEVIGDESFLRTPTGEGKFPMQEFYRRAYDVGLVNNQYNRAMEYADFLAGNNEYVIEMARAHSARRFENRSAEIRNNPDLANLDSMRSNPAISFLEWKNQKVVNSMGKTLSFRRRVIGPDGKVIKDVFAYGSKDRQLQQYIKEFQSIFGKDITFDVIDWWCKGQDGYTYNQGVGNDDVDLANLKKSMSKVLENLRNYGIPVTCYEHGKSFGGRYALPGQVQYQIDWMWEHGRQFLESKHGTKEEFERKISEETDKALEVIAQIDKSDLSQRIRLSQAMQWYYREMGKPLPSSLYVYNGTYIMDIADMYNDIAADMLGANMFTPEEVDEMRVMAERERKVIGDMRNRADMNDTRHKANVPITPGGVTSSSDYNDAWSGERVLNNIATASQVMAVSHPLVTGSNLMDRFVGQTCMDWGLRIAQKTNLGPYKANHWLDPKIVEQAVNDPLFIKLYVAYRKAGFTGEELVFLSQAQGEEDINSWLAEREKNQTVFQKAVDRIYGMASGGNMMLKTQMKNFVNRFAQFAEANGQDFWFSDVGGISMLEASIAGDGAGKWFADVLGANNAYTPSFTIALQALNSAKAGDMAQRHVLSMMYGEIVRRMPLSKFFVTTTICRFPQYSLNVTHRMLSWIAPMSSVYYVFTNMVSKISPDMHYEQAQVHRSLQEAMYVDLMHLGRSALCMVLIGCSELMQPPDDEKKWLNIDDWTIGGMRIGEEWWIKDVLGMALPVAAFARAAMLGRPDMNILSNGLADVCFSNPIIKVSDAIGFLLDPEDGLITDFEEDQERYAKAPQGAPSWWEYVGTQAKAGVLSWSAQFITPSLLRDFYVNMQPYEASYKRVFKTSATGVTLPGEENTQLTTYDDAMVRRVTRRNPTLAWLLDIVLHPETGYAWDEMPNVVMYDDAQIAQSEIWSIKGMSDDDANAKLLEIIEVLERYDDMNELKQTGFYLDAETRTALSSAIWDIYHGLDDWFYSAKQSGELDYYVLGDGSWTDGKAKYDEIYHDLSLQKQHWSNFYYNKVKNSYLSKPMQQYNRYNTTYNRDADGNIYATGIRPSGVLPITVAPGSLSDPGTTAGYENDWAAISAVTNEPMNQRALVAVPSEYSEWPDLEDWADGGDGNSYSKRYRQQYGTSGSAYGGTGDTTTSYPSSGGSRRSGGGGGGGRSGAPNAYAPSISLPRANAGRIMNTDKLVQPSYEYLRPDFETKGSREAYRRSDI